MRFIILIILIAGGISASLYGQETLQQLPNHEEYPHHNHHAQDFFPCATIPQKSAWLKEYQRNPAAFSHFTENRTGVTYLPMTFHVVGQDDSTGFASLDNVFGSFCQLNADYAPYGIQFFIEPPIRFIANSAFYEHDTILVGGGFMLNYNVDSTINVYFMADPAGACGYNLPYAGVAMNNGCLGGHTFAHELGHQLSIQHTFYGWEGGISWDDGVDHDFSDPAPDYVVMNYTGFKDTMWQDTLIIDTAYVERVARTGPTANCGVAADGFCDTPADYISSRWTCDNQGLSDLEQTDPDTVTFFSEGQNIMSYSDNNCRAIFSNEQIAAMNAFIQSERQHQLYNQNPMRDTITNAPIVEEPTTNINMPENAVTFRWNSVSGATHYLLTSTKLQATYTPDQRMDYVIVSDTFFTSSLNYPPRPDFLPYYWKVKPLNYGYTCAPYSTEISFNTDAVSGLIAIDDRFSCNMEVLFGKQVLLTGNSQIVGNLEATWISTTGQVVDKNILQMEEGTYQLWLPTDKFISGIYFLNIRIDDLNKTFKVMIP